MGQILKDIGSIYETATLGEIPVFYRYWCQNQETENQEQRISTMFIIINQIQNNIVIEKGNRTPFKVNASSLSFSLQKGREMNE